MLLQTCNQQMLGKCSLVLMSQKWRLCSTSPSSTGKEHSLWEIRQSQVKKTTFYCISDLFILYSQTTRDSNTGVQHLSPYTAALLSFSDSGIIDDDWQYTSFHPTPKMSTYLFAFTVSEFTSIPSTHERVDIKVCVRDWRAHHDAQLNSGAIEHKDPELICLD